MHLLKSDGKMYAQGFCSVGRANCVTFIGHTSLMLINVGKKGSSEKLLPFFIFY